MTLPGASVPADKQDLRALVILLSVVFPNIAGFGVVIPLLPFFGKAHVAYIPNGRIVGLSNIPRVVDAFARRLQVQERLTNEIRDCVHDTLQPLGVAVVIEAAHLCMQMRGIQKQNSVTTTSAFTGIFLNDNRTRDEFIKLISTSLH